MSDRCGRKPVLSSLLPLPSLPLPPPPLSDPGIALTIYGRYVTMDNPLPPPSLPPFLPPFSSSASSSPTTQRKRGRESNSPSLSGISFNGANRQIRRRHRRAEAELENERCGVAREFLIFFISSSVSDTVRTWSWLNCGVQAEAGVSDPLHADMRTPRHGACIEYQY